MKGLSWDHPRLWGGRPGLGPVGCVSWAEPLLFSAWNRGEEPQAMLVLSLHAHPPKSGRNFYKFCCWRGSEFSFEPIGKILLIPRFFAFFLHLSIIF